MDEIVTLNANRTGKSFRTFMGFIKDIQSGKSPIIIGRDYVVISKEKFNEIQKQLSSMDKKV